MVDPYAVTDFARSRRDLEEYWLFCLAVAGKKASAIAPKVAAFLDSMAEGETPFAYIRRLVREDRLEEALQEARLGKYGLLAKAYRVSSAAGGVDIAVADAEVLETIPGVGPKTARYFITHSREGVRMAIIDTHVLKYLAHLGHAVPKGVPGGREYARLEALMIEAQERSGMSPAAFDLAVWTHYATRGGSALPELPPMTGSDDPADE